MPNWPDDSWPINLIEASAYAHMDTGPVVVGLVRIVDRDGFRYFAVQDGGYWHHPALAEYLGSQICVHFDAAVGSFEVQSWPERRKLADLPAVLLN